MNLSLVHFDAVSLDNVFLCQLVFLKILPEPSSLW